MGRSGDEKRNIFVGMALGDIEYKEQSIYTVVYLDKK